MVRIIYPFEGRIPATERQKLTKCCVLIGVFIAIKRHHDHVNFKKMVYSFYYGSCRQRLFIHFLATHIRFLHFIFFSIYIPTTISPSASLPLPYISLQSTPSTPQKGTLS